MNEICEIRANISLRFVIWNICKQATLHKKWSFPLRISSVNEKLHFFVQCYPSFATTTKALSNKTGEKFCERLTPEAATGGVLESLF